ncbi:hypothetical protein MMC26_005816 [Xylographa opegraphella]|nr:hypothetical protein [Xylographa opegraphella]
MGLSGAPVYGLILAILLVACLATGALLLYMRRRSLRKACESSRLEDAPPRRITIEQQIRPQGGMVIFELDAVDSEFGRKSQSSVVQIPPKVHSRSGSLSSTLIGSRKSLKLVRATPNSSMISLPLDNKNSPLRQNPITTDDGGQFQATRQAPTPGQARGRLRAWEVESLISRPSTATSMANTEIGIACSPTSAYFPRSVPSEPPKLDLQIRDFRASFKSLFSASDADSHFQSQTGVVPRKPVPSYSRRQSRKIPSLPLTPEVELPPPPRVYRGERPFFGGHTVERSSSKSTVGSASVMSRRRGGSVSAEKPRILSAVGDWGAAIFHEIEKTLEDSRSISSSPVKEHHDTRRSSASSSLYSARDSLDEEDKHHQRKASVASAKTYLSSKPLIRAAAHASDNDPPARSPDAKALPPLPYLPSRAYSPPPPPTNPFSHDGHVRISSVAHTPTIVHSVVHARPQSDVLADVYDSYWQEGGGRPDHPPKHQPPSRSKSESAKPRPAFTTRHPPLPPLPFAPGEMSRLRLSGTRFPVVPHSPL